MLGMKRRYPRPRLHLATPVPMPVQFAIRFRISASDTWQDARAEAIAADHLVFVCDIPLELGTLLELALPVGALSQAGIKLNSTYARVVGRVLERWPDITTAVTARFLAHPAQQMPAA